jgi:hypothetical protein
MTRRGSSFLTWALLTLAACGSGASQDNSAQSNEAAPPREALEAQPVKEEHKALALTPAWLAGRWQTGDGDCGAGDTFFSLSPDGRYTFMEEQGRWSLAGKVLTIQVTEAGGEAASKAGDRTTTQVAAIGPNEAEFRPQGLDDPIRVFRCHESG